MTLKLTKTQLRQILPTNKETDAWYTSLAEVLPKYNITSAVRVASFLAQCGHESADFTRLVENLNYSAEGLVKTWPSRFPSTSYASTYARNPEKIANKVYCDRMGNGSEASGDGWRFRGRGLIQLTGKDNYTAFGKTIHLTAAEVVDYISSKKGAVEAACWFWDIKNLNRLSDTQDIVAITKLINGGTNGLDDRKNRYNNALHILNT